MAIHTTGGSESRQRADVTGSLAPCPDCGRATGVPLPRGSTVAEDPDVADGASPTRCRDCGTRFEVPYTR